MANDSRDSNKKVRVKIVILELLLERVDSVHAYYISKMKGFAYSSVHEALRKLVHLGFLLEPVWKIDPESGKERCMYSINPSKRERALVLVKDFYKDQDFTEFEKEAGESPFKLDRNIK